MDKPMKTLLPTTLLALLLLGASAGAASAIEIHDTGVPSLKSGSTGQLVIGGIVGRGPSDPQARKCYGSTLCRESGSYYSNKGVLHYRNGDRLDGDPRPSGVKTSNEPSN
jgi:hypothetical protein